MQKKIVLIITVVILIGLGFVIFEQTKYTTYDEVISGMIIESDMVNEIIIEDYRNELEVSIKDKNMIESLLEDPANMELKKHDSPPTIDYWIDVNTGDGTYEIILGESDIQIGDGHYQIVNESVLYQLIKSEDLDWKSVN